MSGSAPKVMIIGLDGVPLELVRRREQVDGGGDEVRERLWG